MPFALSYGAKFILQNLVETGSLPRSISALDHELTYSSQSSAQSRWVMVALFLSVTSGTEALNHLMYRDSVVGTLISLALFARYGRPINDWIRDHFGNSELLMEAHAHFAQYSQPRCNPEDHFDSTLTPARSQYSSVIRKRLKRAYRFGSCGPQNHQRA